MRKNQVSISITRFGDEAKNGTIKRTIHVYCDSNEIWEALSGAYVEAVNEITKSKNLPEFGRREHKMVENIEVKTFDDIKPFKFDTDSIHFLIKNEFRIEWDVFARQATKPEIKRIMELMPKGSPLHFALKGVADKSLYPDGSSRGIYYDLLVKTVAGFSLGWNKEKLSY